MIRQVDPPSVLHRLVGTLRHRGVVDGHGIRVSHRSGCQLAAFRSHCFSVVTTSDMNERVKTKRYVLYGAVDIEPFKALYLSHPDSGPVHSDTNSISLGLIQSRCNYCANTFHSHYHHCL